MRSYPTRKCPKCGNPMAYYGPKQCRDCWRGLRPLIDNGDGTHTVVLTRGKTALIDSADAERVGKRNWQFGGHGYACNGITGGVIQYLHRFILDAKDGEFVDHVNRKRLDCRRSNLRIATWGQNVANTTKPPGASGYFGVELRCDGNKWTARIQAGGKAHYLGSFPTPEDAARAYDDAAIRLHGKFARLNFPPQ